MSDIAIKVENLSKRYQLGNKASGSLRHTLTDAWNGLFGKNKSSTNEEFWALKDVSFEIKKGEVVGIIGRNGAGKSTLLKILSKITEPTAGRITLDGRVASLLEVGTGFHPELTGRENIFLNGALLGMTRQEIKRKFDEIIDFSGVEKFIDTPVKKYSSGMYVRLAFAVAAHLEPEILLVDEVLAVGDMEFQKKCLGKMDEVAKGGRTVVFVSHNMGMVETLCPLSILLRKGKFIRKDDSPTIIEKYYNTIYYQNNNSQYTQNDYDTWNHTLKIDFVRLINKKVNVVITSQIPMIDIGVIVSISDSKGNLIFKSSTAPIWGRDLISFNKKLKIVLDISNLILISGKYIIGVAISYPEKKIISEIKNALLVEVKNNSIYDGSKVLNNKKDGFLMIPHKWTIIEQS